MIKTHESTVSIIQLNSLAKLRKLKSKQTIFAIYMDFQLTKTIFTNNTDEGKFMRVTL